MHRNRHSFPTRRSSDLELKFGEISAMCGAASFEAVKRVIELALEGEVDATVTGPINKKSINEAGHHFAGHTEIYAHYTGTKKDRKSTRLNSSHLVISYA